MQVTQNTCISKIKMMSNFHQYMYSSNKYDLPVPSLLSCRRNDW